MPILREQSQIIDLLPDDSVTECRDSMSVQQESSDSHDDSQA